MYRIATYTPLHLIYLLTTQLFQIDMLEYLTCVHYDLDTISCLHVPLHLISGHRSFEKFVNVQGHVKNVGNLEKFWM